MSIRDLIGLIVDETPRFLSIRSREQACVCPGMRISDAFLFPVTCFLLLIRVVTVGFVTMREVFGGVFLNAEPR